MAISTDLPDSELRKLLGKYMEDVPPVTDTTRSLLQSKLEKFLSESNPESIGLNGMDKLPATPVKSPRKRQDVVAKPAASSVSETPSKGSPNQSVQSPTQGASFLKSPSGQSSPILDYAFRLPTYRRRSIHPDRPGLDSPYSNLQLSEAISYVSDSCCRSPDPKCTVKRRLSTGVASLSELPSNVTFCIRSMIGKSWEVLKNSTTLRIFPSKWMSFVFLALLVLLIISRLLLSDPFYRNPVDDLKIQKTLAV